MTLARTAAPAANPITLDEVKAQLRVTSSDEDTHINSLIAAAVSYVDGTGVLGRAMITQDWAQWVSASPGPVRLLIGPVQELVSVQYYDTDNAIQTATLSDFELRLAGDFSTILPKSGKSWPASYSRSDAIKITYRAGFGDTGTDVPAGVRLALIMLVAHWYENREAATDAPIHSLPMAFDALINGERVSWYG